MSSNIKYSIPGEIKGRIPDCFYTAMAGELFAIYGYEIATKLFEMDSAGSWMGLDTSTRGWHAAFFMACKKLNMEWLYEYRSDLARFELNLFDAEIEEEIYSRFVLRYNNLYYKYILTTMREQSAEK